MKRLERLRQQSLLDIALHSILLLFFLQLLTDFIAAIYAFGLLGTSLPLEIAAVLFLFSPLLLLLMPRGLKGWPLVITGELMLVARVVEPLLNTRGTMFVSGLGVACFLLLLPSMLNRRSGEQAESTGITFGLALAIALSLSILFRALNSGTDISTYGMFQLIGWLLAAVAALLLLDLRARGPAAASPPGSPDEPLGSTVGPSFGLVAVLLLCYLAFSSPNVFARWTGASYPPIVVVLALVLCLFVFVLASRPRLLSKLNPALVLGWNLLFVLALVLTILPHQIPFPAGTASHPLSEPSITAWHHIALYLMLILFPVMLVDFMLFAQQLGTNPASPRHLGASFGLASLFVLVMIFAHIFTTVYDYIPVVGPLFRDQFWLVYLVASITPALPLLWISSDSYRAVQAPRKLGAGSLYPALLLAVAVLAIAGVLFTAARPAPTPAQTNTLKILTYNVQQGYSEDGLWNYDRQLALIRKQDPDVVGLQECDTNRIANGNADLVRFFADRLDMYSYYGPKVVPGTFGIALLSKYPIENPRTFFMYSIGEQTATIEAQITAGDRTFNFYVTHLGNGGPIVQQEAILHEMEGKQNIIAIGDFNFRPDTPQYTLTTETLDDSWLLRWPGGNQDQGIDPARRVDHIFVSPGTRVAASQYLAGPQSDHPAMTTTIEW